MHRSALTVDLEEYFQVSNFETCIDRSDWDGIASRVREPTERLLDLFDVAGRRATFFVLGWVAERQPALVRHVAERGHEVACHGYGHRLVYEIGPQAFREDVKRARAAIEDACGVAVTGYRAPSFSITRDSLWALETLAELGFHYDSSIFPVHHPRYGIPEFSRRPVRIRLPEGASLLEFPGTALRIGPVALALGGGAYLRFLPFALFRAGLRRLRRQGFPTTLYLHPWELDPAQPRQRVSRRVRVNHYHNLGKVEGRVQALLEEFAFAPMGEVLGALEREGEIGDGEWVLSRAAAPSGERSSGVGATQFALRATMPR